MTLAPWLQSLLWASFYASALALAVLALQLPLRRHIPARWSLILWTIVLLRFIPFTLPESRLSPFTLFAPTSHVTQAAPASQAPRVPVLTAQPDPVSAPLKPTSPPILTARPSGAPRIAAAPSPTPAAPARPVIPLSTLLFFAGAAIIATRHLLATLSLGPIVRRATPVHDPAHLSILNDVRQTLDIRRPIPLLATQDLASPAIVGFFKPKLLLPAGLAATLSQDELRLVFLHEAAHIRRRDVLLNYALAGLQIVHWFNPVVWLLVPRIRAERELACDELVLRHTASPGPYGHILLKLLAVATPLRPLAPAVGIVETKTFFKRRIRMIATFRKRPTWYLFPIAAAVALASVCVFTSPASRAQNSPPAPGAMRTPTPIEAPAKPNPLPDSLPDSPPNHLPNPHASMDEKLAQTGPLHLTDVPFSQFIDTFSQAYNLDVNVNWKAVESVGVNRDTKVSANFKNISARKALDVVLQNVAGGAGVLDFMADEGIITVSSAVDITAAEQRRDARIAGQNPPTTPAMPATPGMPVMGFATPFKSGPVTAVQVAAQTPNGPVTFSASGDSAAEIANLRKQLDELNLKRADAAQTLGPLSPVMTLLDHQMDSLTHMMETQLNAARTAEAAQAANDVKLSLKTYDVHDLLDVPPTQATVLTTDQQGALRDLVTSLQTMIKAPNMTISAVNGTLMVKATDETHEQVRDILNQLEAAHADRVARVQHAASAEKH